MLRGFMKQGGGLPLTVLGFFGLALSGLAVVAGCVSLYLSFGTDHAAKSPSVAVPPLRVILAVPF